jgi:hypothetical protein
MNDWPPQLWGAIVAVVGAVAGTVGKRLNNRADAAVVLTDGALRVVNELQQELDGIRRRMGRIETEQRHERAWCDMRIDQLVSALHRSGIEVPPPPPRPEFNQRED